VQSNAGSCQPSSQFSVGTSSALIDEIDDPQEVRMMGKPVVVSLLDFVEGLGGEIEMPSLSAHG
jgi:hypothetical protein